MWARGEPLGTHLSRLYLGLEFLEHIVVALQNLLGPDWHPINVFLVGIAQWLWYKTRESEPLDLGRCY